MSVQLYRHFNQSEELLYVGISISAMSRLGQHAAVSPWFKDITRVMIETFPAREDALTAEKEAIKTEHPKFNTHHNKPPKPVRPWKTVTQSERVAGAETEIIRQVTTLKAVYTMAEASNVLGIATSTVTKLLKSGELGFIEVPKMRVAGFNTKITGWQILEYLENQMKKSCPNAYHCAESHPEAP